MSKTQLTLNDDIPDDISKIQKLLQVHSAIAPEDVLEHVTTIREKAWKIYPYNCIASWRFIDLYITSRPDYADLVTRLKAERARFQPGNKFLDLGCCFGQVLRQLAADGVPEGNLYGADLERAFIDLGYDLFTDRDTFGATFVTGDVLASGPTGLDELNGKIDVVHAASFFHLFDWDNQVRAAERVVRFFKSSAIDALIIGRQVGARSPREGNFTRREGNRYIHSPESLQKLWDEVSQKTNSRWEVSAELVDINSERCDISFVIRRRGVKEKSGANS